MAGRNWLPVAEDQSYGERLERRMSISTLRWADDDTQVVLKEILNLSDIRVTHKGIQTLKNRNLSNSFTRLSAQQI